MTVDEAIKRLQEIKSNGDGRLPLQVFLIDESIPYAADIETIETAEPADGDRVWIHPGKVHSPEWSF